MHSILGSFEGEVYRQQMCREAIRSLFNKILTLFYPYPHYFKIFSALKAEYHKTVLGGWFQDFNICYTDVKYSPSQC
jgi:hypothetical protein